MSSPTIRSQNVWESQNGNDTLQIVNAAGTVVGGIDSTGTPFGNLGSGGSGGGVSSLNALTGAVVISAGANVTVTPAGNTLTIASTGGTVTSVSFTGGLISVANPATTPALTVAGTSGGIPYFSGAATWATSAQLTANSPVLGGGAGTAPSTKTFLTTDGAATLTVGVIGGGNGVVALAGNTSGSCTQTTDATSTTLTDSCLRKLPNGTASAPSLQLGASNLGFYSVSGTEMRATVNNQDALRFAKGSSIFIGMPQTATLYWTGSTDPSAAGTLGLSQVSSGVLGVSSDGSQGGTGGTLQAANLVATTFKVGGLTPSVATGNLSVPQQVGFVSCTQANCASSATTLFTVGANNALFRIDTGVACTGSAAAATAITTLTYTDPSNTVQTITIPTATCTTLGAASVASNSTIINAKNATAIQYSVAQANTPAFQARISVYEESLQ